jgi:hypothetical protein
LQHAGSFIDDIVAVVQSLAGEKPGSQLYKELYERLDSLVFDLYKFRGDERKLTLRSSGSKRYS